MIRIILMSAAMAFTPVAFGQNHVNHDGHDHAGEAGEHDGHGAEAAVQLSLTPEIEAGLEAGGEAVVVEVLGAVCDFCAKAMNKTFGRRDDVAAVYVDLDSKTLNLVLMPEAVMDDAEISRVVVRSGYRAKAIHRGAHILGGDHASDPA